MLRNSRQALLASLIFAVSLGGVVAANAASYKLTILRPIAERTSTQAQYGLNEAGRTAGTSGGAGERVATVWDRRGHPQSLARPKIATFSRASAISNRGIVVGAVDTTGADDLTGLRATRWTNSDHYQLLLPEIGYDNDAVAVNDEGWVAGIQFDGSVYTAFLITPSGHVDYPAPLATGDDFELLSINKFHQAAGFDAGDAGTFAVKWTRSGLQRLPLLPGGSISASASLNDLGVVAGVADDSAGNYHAVRWYSNGRVIALPSLANAIYSDGQNGINNFGFSVGVTVYAGTDPDDFNSQRATLWDSRGRPHDLNFLIDDNRVTLLTANSINDLGEIFGDAIEETGKRFAYLLTPRWPMRQWCEEFDRDRLMQGTQTKTLSDRR